MSTIKNLIAFDYIALLICFALAAFGVLSIAGATYEQLNNFLWVQQVKWVLLGCLILFGVLAVDYQFLIRYASVFYALGILGLLLCFSPVIGHESHGANSWIKIAAVPPVQPSELAKLTTILLLAKVLAARQEQWNGFLDVMKPLVIGIIPALLIIKQPDLGTALVFGPFTLIMMFVAGIPYSYLFLLLSPALCLLGIAHVWFFILIWFIAICSILLNAIVYRVPWTVVVPFIVLAIGAYIMVFAYGETIWEKIPEHQKSRIYGYMDPDFDPKDTNYNINQSKIALGSGGFHGKGFGKGTQSTHGFLPEFQHDFIFPVIGEQWGFLGTSILLGLFLLLILRGLDTALETKTLQGSLLASGIVALFFSHIFINVGMVTGILPVTGLPLTFISYGGTFMLSSMLAVGLLINIRVRSASEMTKDAMFKSRSQMAIPKKFSTDF